MSKSDLSHERLLSLLAYDPETGIFTNLKWRKGIAERRVGSAAGFLNPYGYVRIKVDGRAYQGHRLAWFWMTGKWPKIDIDHIDGNKSNNIWSNLREANKSQNRANRLYKCSNPLKGCYPYRGKFVSKISAGGTKLHLGTFLTAEEAHAAYCVAARRYHGEFARVE